MTVPLLLDIVSLGKVEETLAFLTNRHLSAKKRGKLYEACVTSAMLRVGDQITLELQWLRRNDSPMIYWIDGTIDRDETTSALLLQKLGMEDITAVLHSQRLRWYGYVQRVTSYIRSITSFPIPGSRKQEGQERPGLNVWRWVSVIVAWLVLTCMESWSCIACSCQPHRMGHRQGINGWMHG